MASDIEKACERTDMLTMQIGDQNAFLKDINSQRQKFIRELEQQRWQLKENEKFI